MSCNCLKNVTLYVTDPSLSYLSALEQAIRAAVEELTVCKVGDATPEQVFDASRTGLVLIAGIDRMPMGSKKAIYDYLCKGGRILNMGNGYIFQNVLGEDGQLLEPSDPGMDGTIISTFHDVTELYPITNGVTIGAFANQIFVEDCAYTMPKSLYSCYPRQESTSFGRIRPFRCVPLIEVRNEEGLRSGYAAWMMIYKSKDEQNGEREGSIIATFSGSEEFYDANGIAAVVQTVRAMLRHTFLAEGGTKEYTYLIGKDDELVAGASVMTLGDGGCSGVTTQVTLSKDGKTLAVYMSEGRTPTQTGKGIFSLSDTYSLADGRPDTVRVSLYQDGVEIDRLTQEIHYWQPKPVEQRKFVYTEDGYFKRDGEILHLFGINVMSSTRAGITMDDDYSPEILYNDLKRIKTLGFNVVSMWKNNADNNDMLNTVRMCEELGLFMDLAVSGHIAYPLKPKYNIEKVIECLTKLHFHECDTIIAYDIAWEERVGTYEGCWNVRQNNPGSFVGRKGWDKDWTQWVKDQYGSIEDAEQAWGASCERTAEGYLCVTDAMLDEPSSQYQKLVAAYYRFVDDIVSKLMSEGVAPMKKAAPNQLFSFRMSMAGCGYNWLDLYRPSTFCFDFQNLASSLDLMEPEGYTLGLKWQEAVQVSIATAYARYAKPEAPVLWKEFGWGALDSNRNAPDYNFKPVDDCLQYSTVAYKETLERMLHAQVDGAFCWWNVAGFRRDERGDCGVWNPDGSDRPYTVLLREYAPRIIGQKARPEADVLLTVERDNQVGGITGIYNAVCEEVQRAYEQGKTIAFVNNLQQTPKSVLYADELTDHAVADAKGAQGYPLRYVNGQVKSVEIVEKETGKVALVKVCNTKQSVWRAGKVSLVSVKGSELSVDCPIQQELAYLQDATVELPICGAGELKLRFAVNGVEFGPVYTVNI